MLMNMQRTPFDLNFRLFGIPVRVHPSFWLIAAFFAWPLADRGIPFWFLGVGCLFVLLILHELGHALMFRCYHMGSVILLYSFGGMAIPEGRLPVRSWRIIVTLAGPMANFLLSGLIWGSNFVEAWAPTNDYTRIIYFYFFWVSLYLGLLNLLPVYPLDGGQISRELWMKSQPRMGLINSLRLSMIVAIAFAVYAFACHFNVIPPELLVPWIRPGIFAGILFAILAVENYVEIQNQSRSRSYYDDDRAPWRR